MGRTFWPRIAFCTILFATLLGATGAESRADVAVNRDAYSREQVAKGARKIPVLAQLAYLDALASFEDGERDRAETQLHQALQFDPDYPDPYWTLARLKLTRFELDGSVYLLHAFESSWRTFRGQRLMALNGAVTVALVLLTLNLLVCLAFSIKYLPYVAHKITESVEKRFNASLPVFTAYLILLAPVVLFPGTILSLGYLTVLCWLFMYRREKVLVVIIVAPLVVAGLFDTHLRLAASLSDPNSLTSLIDRANDIGADDQLIHSIERTQTRGLETEKNLALGLSYLKASRYDEASEHLFKAISLRPEQTMGYINLGNIHFLQGDYEKALQGYRKAEDLDDTDPVCQFDLAQAYIKTLLMKKASRSLHLAAENGIEDEKSYYAEVARGVSPVLFKLFSKEDLWRTALAEAESYDDARLDEVFSPLAGTRRKADAWIVIVTLIVAIVLSHVIDPGRLAFQCSNCGRLTCSRCCSPEREMNLCGECAKTIESVTSEKVVEALLRQKRQVVLTRRRKSARFTSIILPGVRDIYYGRILRGVIAAGVFCFSLVYLLTKGSFVRDPVVLMVQTPLWKTILPVVGVVVAYIMSAVSRPSHRFKPRRHRSATQGAVATGGDDPKTARAA